VFEKQSRLNRDFFIKIFVSFSRPDGVEDVVSTLAGLAVAVAINIHFLLLAAIDYQPATSYQ
jgi:hypothetical protein